MNFLPLKLYQLLAWMFTGAEISDAFRQQVWSAGSVILSSGNSAPPGRWLEANGQSVPRPISAGGASDTYQALWAAYGSSALYGSLDAQTFRLPHLSGRAPIGSGTLINNNFTINGESYSQGDRVGEEEHQLIGDELPDKPPKFASGIEQLFAKVTTGGTSSPAATGSWTAREASEIFKTDDSSAAGHENRTPSLVMRYWVAY